MNKGTTLFDQEESLAKQSGLSLPRWDSFLQLYRTLLDAPLAALEVPRVLRFVFAERAL